MSLQRNYYEVLGLPPGATTDQIKKKYRELARKFHPDVIQDKTLGQRVFSQINQAYRILGDPDRRAQYNTSLICAPPGKAEARTAPPPQSYPARPAPTKPVQPVPPSPQQAAGYLDGNLDGNGPESPCSLWTACQRRQCHYGR